MKVIPYEEGKSRPQIAREEEHYTSMDNGEHSFYTRPLIDYDMALFLAPMEMAGAVLGVIIQSLMPNWLFLSLAGFILGVTSIKTYQKFCSSYKKEAEARHARFLAEENDVTNEGTGLDINDKIDIDAVKSCPENIEIESDINSSGGLGEGTVDVPADDEQDICENEVCYSMRSQDSFDCSDSTNEATYQLEDDEEKLKKRRELLKSDARQYPVEKFMYLMILWFGLTAITFLKGGKGVDSLVGINCKSPWYEFLVVSQFLWLLGCATLFGLKLVKRHAVKVQNNYPFHQTDVLWDATQLRLYASFTFLAGIVAGLIGVGGGMILGPTMLVMGIHPRVSSATTATMILLTSSSVAIMFVTSGLVPWEYAVFFFCVCACGALIGKKYIDEYVTKTGMASILIGILSTIIGLATIGCFVIVILNLKNADWCFDGFKPFCEIKNEHALSCPSADKLSAKELFPHMTSLSSF